MSKASEYAGRFHVGVMASPIPMCPSFYTERNTWPVAYVTIDGGLEFPENPYAVGLTPQEVAALTAWLIDTFGERVTT